MSTESAAAANPALTQTTSFLPAQLAPMEAARAVWDLIGEDHIDNLVVVGGAALLFHGSRIFTCDADLAIIHDSLGKFEERFGGYLHECSDIP
ncbi:hypothetical protein HOY80DRAFT_1060883 [Tuber brumale]|nr:hypothetical protein HOY80DRAFT_1060883 [Tuber brumale]